MELEEYLAIPYILRMESDTDRDGGYIVRAEHPELPACIVEGRTPLEALDRLDAARRRLIETRFARGETIPVPRAPLRDLLPHRPHPSPRPFRIVGGAA